MHIHNSYHMFQLTCSKPSHSHDTELVRQRCMMTQPNRNVNFSFNDVKFTHKSCLSFWQNRNTTFSLNDDKPAQKACLMTSEITMLSNLV